MSTGDIRLLFRFRDLVAPTIDEHRAIIGDRGSCWWGWWKRPTEDHRSDVWRELANGASVPEPAVVGLFNSGSGRVFLAKVVEVIEPSLHAHAIAHITRSGRTDPVLLQEQPVQSRVDAFMRHFGPDRFL